MTQHYLQAETTHPVLEAIYTRRAMRKFTEQAVKPDVLNQLLDAGRMAPSAFNGQPWVFRIVRNPVLIKQISSAIGHYTLRQVWKNGPRGVISAIRSMFTFVRTLRHHHPHDHVFYGAPIVIFIAGPRVSEWAALDIGMCAQNILLAATALGLASCPVGFGKFIAHTPYYKQLQLGADEMVYLSIAIGYAADTPPVTQRITGNVQYID